MAWMVAISPCWSCGQVFSYNPDLVPSIPIDGVRQPICGKCVERANPRRIENGLEPIEVLPGAYEEQEVD
jgi:hypothetical protein